jgi:hypothetical protein
MARHFNAGIAVARRKADPYQSLDRVEFNRSFTFPKSMVVSGAFATSRVVVAMSAIGKRHARAQWPRW